MNYTIKIEGTDENSGSISFQRLITLAEGIRKISEGALFIRLKGFSGGKGRKKSSLEKALEITLSGITAGSTVIHLQANPFSETLKDFQFDLFRQEMHHKLPEQTPMSLFISTFQEALKENPSPDLLDKPLLNELKKFKKTFVTANEKMLISNDKSVDKLEISNHTFKRIKNLEQTLPKPKTIVLNGKLEMLKYSKQRVSILTEEGSIDGFLGENIKPEEIGAHWGREITVVGISHFKPGGRSIIEIEKFTEPAKGDSYFSRRPKSETIEQQLQRQANEGKKANPLSDIIGKWPGNETEEEFQEIMKNLD